MFKRKMPKIPEMIHPPVLFLNATATQGHLGDIIFVKASGEYWETLDWTVAQPYDAWYMHQTRQHQIDVPLRRLGPYEVTCTAYNPETGLQVSESVMIHCLEDNSEMILKRIERNEDRVDRTLKLMVELEARIDELERKLDGTSTGL